MLRYPPSLPAKPKAGAPEPAPRSVLCGAFSSKSHRKLAYLTHPNLLVNSDPKLSSERSPGERAATNERGRGGGGGGGKLQRAGGTTYHEEDSSQHLVFAYSSPVLLERVDHLLAHVELGVAAALQAIQHTLGVLQMFLSSVAQRVGLKPTPQAAHAEGASIASQVGVQQVPQHGEGQTSLQILQSPRAFEHQHSKPQSLAPLAHMHNTTPSSNGAASSANMFTTAAQQRIAIAVQGLQQSPAIVAACSLSPLQRVAGAALVLLAVVGPQIMLFKARRRAADAEAEKQRRANALSLKLQKQRFRAALAFDAVHLDLPGIKESDVDPSDLVARVAGTSQGHPVELEGAIRKEWLQFMSASKVGLVTDLWDAKSKACNDNGPAASRAELEEMTRRVREANSITGGSRHRSIGEEQKAAAEAGDEDGWFLTKGDGRDSHPGPSSDRACGSYKDAQEAQIDMESMEERAARRRARMADQFASDEDVASMWTERRAGSTNRPRPPLYHPPKAIPDSHSARAGTQVAGSRESASLEGIPKSTRGTSSQVNLEQQQQEVPLDTHLSRSRELDSRNMGTRIQEVTPNPPSSFKAGGPHTKRLLRAQPLPPGTLPNSVFGAAVPPWRLPVPTYPEVSHPHTLPTQHSASTPHQHASMLHERSNQFGGVASNAMGWSDTAAVGFDTKQVPLSHTAAAGSSSSSNSSNSSTSSTSVRMSRGSGSSRASIGKGVSTAEPEWGGLGTQSCPEETDVLAAAGSGRWAHQGQIVPSRAAAWQHGDLSSIGYFSNGAAGQLDEHMKQDAMLFVASPEHTSPLLAARSNNLGFSSIRSKTGMPSQSSTSSRLTPPSSCGMQTVPHAAEPTPTPGPSPVPSEADAPVVAADPESKAMEGQAGIQEDMRAEDGRIASCSSTGKDGAANPGTEKFEVQETQGQAERAGSTADAEARLARFMRRPTSRKADQ